MGWQVLEYLEENPNAGIKDVINHFADKLEINKQVQYLKEEVDRVLEIRIQLRPLYAEKINFESQLLLMDSDFDMQVMVKYPPRKGSDKERKAYKTELQKQSKDYRSTELKINDIKNEIELLEEEMETVQQNAKNARKLIDLFNSHIQVLLNGGLTMTLEESAKTETSNNSNMF